MIAERQALDRANRSSTAPGPFGATDAYGEIIEAGQHLAHRSAISGGHEHENR
jgi:hypothetical protein